MQDGSRRRCDISRAAGGWGTSVGAMGLALQLGSRSYPMTALQKCLQKAAFPVYCLHQVVVVSLAEVFVFKLRSSVAMKVCILAAFTNLISVVLYKVACTAPVLPQIGFGVSF